MEKFHNETPPTEVGAFVTFFPKFTLQLPSIHFPLMLDIIQYWCCFQSHCRYAIFTWPYL